MRVASFTDTIDQGCGWCIGIHLRKSDGSAFNLSGGSLTFQIRTNAHRTTSPRAVPNILIPNPVAGDFTAALSSYETSQLPAPGAKFSQTTPMFGEIDFSYYDDPKNPQRVGEAILSISPGGNIPPDPTAEDPTIPTQWFTLIVYGERVVPSINCLLADRDDANSDAMEVDVGGVAAGSLADTDGASADFLTAAAGAFIVDADASSADVLAASSATVASVVDSDASDADSMLAAFGAMIEDSDAADTDTLVALSLTGGAFLASSTPPDVDALTAAQATACSVYDFDSVGTDSMAANNGSTVTASIVDADAASSDALYATDTLGEVAFQGGAFQSDSFQGPAAFQVTAFQHDAFQMDG